MKSVKVFLGAMYMYLMLGGMVQWAFACFGPERTTELAIVINLFELVMVIALLLFGLSFSRRAAEKYGKNEVKELQSDWKQMKLGLIPFYGLNFSKWLLMGGISGGLARFSFVFPTIVTWLFIVESGIVGNYYIKYLQRQPENAGKPLAVHNILQLLPVLDVVSTLVLVMKYDVGIESLSDSDGQMHKKRKEPIRKKIALLCTSVLFIGTLFCVLRAFYLEWGTIQISQEEQNVWTNAEERSQGNCVLVCERNGITTFPFIFGESLYIYDIKNDTWKLVETNKLPLLTFGEKLSMQGGCIYYNKDFNGPGIALYLKDMNRYGTEIEVLDEVDDYVISSDTMYYLKEREPLEIDGIYEDNNVYRKDIRTGKESVLLQGAMSYLKADKNYLYSYDERKKEIIEVSLQTEGKKTFKEFDTPCWIEEIDKDNIICADYEVIMKYNKRSNQKNILKEMKNEMFVEAGTYRDGYFYYYADKDFYKLDVNSGKETKVMSLAETKDLGKYIKGHDMFEWISYCTDYIAVEVLYAVPGKLIEETDHKRLLIFDYNGKLIKDFKLMA